MLGSGRKFLDNGAAVARRPAFQLLLLFFLFPLVVVNNSSSSGVNIGCLRGCCCLFS
jgi:hypothetical protein